MQKRMIEESVPRSNARIERLTAPLLTTMRQSGRRMFLAWFVPGLVLGGIITALLVAGSEYSVTRALGVGLTLTAFFILPAFLVRDRTNKQLQFALSLTRDAPIYRVLAFHPQSTNLSRLTVQWKEADRFEWGAIQVPYHRRKFEGEAAVLALQNNDAIGIVLSDSEMYMGLRLNERERRGLPESAPEPTDR